jgi:squalene-associated FAD-dependent desaturase
MSRRDVAVVGGGLAGITAALRCADAGRTVTLYEATPRLGGLTHSFRRGELDVDNGQHVFLRCCTAYQQLLGRLGVADRVALQSRLDIAVHYPGSTRPARLRRSALPAPLHLSAALARYAPLSPAERLAFVRAALALRRVDPADPATDAQSFGAWLTAHGQSERAVTTLWDMVGVATLNATAANASLALAATVFQVGLLTETAAADIGWSRVPLSRLHAEPARQCLAAAGAQVRTGARVVAIAPYAGRWIVRSQQGDHMVDQLVLAVPPQAAERLLPLGSTPLPEGWAERLGSSPIVNAHVVYDRRVMARDFIAGIDTPIQWVFDRTQQSGLATGQYLAVSLSAADDLVGLPTAELRARLLPALGALLPAARQAEIVDFFVTRERHATFRPSPGTARLRPGATTAAPGLFLAGAWTATGWPATMEGAVRSGNAAADALLAERIRTGSEVGA